MQKSYDEAYIVAMGKEKAEKRIYNPKFMTSTGISIVDGIGKTVLKFSQVVSS